MDLLYKPQYGIGPLLNLLYASVVPGSAVSSTEKPSNKAPQGKTSIKVFFFKEKKKSSANLLQFMFAL